MDTIRTYAKPHYLDADDGLDGYARRGVKLSRDSASVVIAALYRDAFAMRERGGSANLDGAAENDALAWAIGKAVTHS